MTTYTKKTTTTETLYSTYKNYEKESLLNKIRNRKQHKNLRQEIKELEKETTAILTKYNELKNKTVFSPFKKNYLRKNTPNIKLYSTDYANFIKSKFNLTTIESFGLESIYIFLSLILIPICFSYYIFDENILIDLEILKINITRCTDNNLTIIEKWTPTKRKEFANLAEENVSKAINSKSWKIVDGNPRITFLTLTREEFLALKTHHVMIKTPINETMDFIKIPTRHQTNIRDILKVKSPNYIPTIRHYSDLMSSEAVKSEYNYLTKVSLDPYINESLTYSETYNRAYSKFLKHRVPMKDFELSYLDFLSTELNHSDEKRELIKEKYFCARFYGQLLDFTNFRKSTNIK